MEHCSALLSRQPITAATTTGKHRHPASLLHAEQDAVRQLVSRMDMPKANVSQKYTNFGERGVALLLAALELMAVSPQF